MNVNKISSYGLGGLTLLVLLGTATSASAMNDPVTGRWINRDPIGYQAGTFNLYEHISSNPHSWLDPFGLKAWPATEEWNDGNIQKLRCCIKKKLEEWAEEKNTDQDCGDTALRALIECAKELGMGLRFWLPGPDGKYRWVTSNDKEFKNMADFLAKIQDDTGTANLSDNSKGIDPKNLKPGDLVLMLRQTANTQGHTMVVLENDQKNKKVTIGEGHWSPTGTPRKPVNKRTLTYDEIRRFRRNDGHGGARLWPRPRIGLPPSSKKKKPTSKPTSRSTTGDPCD